MLKISAIHIPVSPNVFRVRLSAMLAIKTPKSVKVILVVMFVFSIGVVLVLKVFCCVFKNL